MSNYNRNFYLLLVGSLIVIFVMILSIPKDDLMSELGNFIDQAKAEARAERISVYVESLETGESAGFEEDVPAYGASLRKLPVLMAVLRMAEEHPEILSKKLTYNQQIKEHFGVKDQYPPIQEPLQIGESYTTENLLERMVTLSDNASGNMFQAYIPDLPQRMNDVYVSVGITTSTQNPDYFSPKDISKMFSALYTHTYVGPQMSDYALNLLSETEFENGLVAGVPPEVRVAHKFGTFTADGNKRALSDCGIVFSHHPYFICVMTLGTDTDASKLEGVIRDISSITYKHTM